MFARSGTGYPCPTVRQQAQLILYVYGRVVSTSELKVKLLNVSTATKPLTTVPEVPLGVMVTGMDPVCPGCSSIAPNPAVNPSMSPHTLLSGDVTVGSKVLVVTSPAHENTVLTAKAVPVSLGPHDHTDAGRSLSGATSVATASSPNDPARASG